MPNLSPPLGSGVLVSLVPSLIKKSCNNDKKLMSEFEQRLEKIEGRAFFYDMATIAVFIAGVAGILKIFA